MKKLCCAVACGLSLALAAPALAGVTIVYPISGATYPITDPAPGAVKSAYFTSSFSVSCSGGGHRVQWGFDSQKPLGSATFYDQTSIQFVHKLPGGTHLFWVKSDCGESRVKFGLGM